MSSEKFARDMYNLALGFFSPSWALGSISRNHQLQGLNDRALELWAIPKGTPRDKYIGKQIHKTLVPKYFAPTHWGLIENLFQDAEDVEVSGQMTQLRTMGTKPIAIAAWDDSDRKCWVRFRVLKNQEDEMCAIFVAIPEEEGESDVLNDRLTGFAVSAVQSILDPETLKKTNTWLRSWITQVAALLGLAGITVGGGSQLPVFKQEALPERPSDIQPDIIEGSGYLVQLQQLAEEYGLVRVFVGRYISDRQGISIHYREDEQYTIPLLEPFLTDVHLEGGFFEDRYRLHRRRECQTVITSQMEDVRAKMIFEDSGTVAQLNCGFGISFIGAELDTEEIPPGLEEALKVLRPPDA